MAKKKYIMRALSVGLSLALCAGLVMPSFAAATFTDLQNAIDSKIGVGQDLGGGRWGYGSSLNDEKTKYEIEAWNGTRTETVKKDDGTEETKEVSTRYVTLYDDVEYNREAGDKTTHNRGIYIGERKDVTLDLNGHDIDLNPGYKLDMETGKFQDTGGNEAAQNDLNQSSVIRVAKYAALTIDDSKATGSVKDGTYVSGQITGGTGTLDGGSNSVTGGGINNEGTLTMIGGTISGNKAKYGGGINNEGTLMMTGGTISGNTASGDGGGVYNSRTFTMEGGAISKNTVSLWGGGVGNSCTFKMTGDAIISNNVAKREGGGVNVTKQGTFTMGGGTNSGNTASVNGGGIYSLGTVTMNGGTISSNTAGKYGGGVCNTYESTGAAVFTMNGGIISGNTANQGGGIYNGKIITGKDGNPVDPFDPDFIPDEDGQKIIVKATWEKLPSKTGGPSRFDYGETQIDDVAVPLAGLFTRADAIGYLWEKSGSPEWTLSDFPDVPEDHQWAVAIGWAQEMGIALPDLDGNFRPDDLVLRSVEDIKLSPEGELEQFLNRYAVYAGIELEPGKLFFALDGEWDEIIMGEDAQIIFNAFFAKLEAALAELAA